MLEQAVTKASEQANQRGMSPDKAEEHVKKAIHKTLLRIGTLLCDKKSGLRLPLLRFGGHPARRMSRGFVS
jgi:hypothetical protein